MQVVFYTYPPFWAIYGGREIQVVKTAEALNKNTQAKVSFLNFWEQNIEFDILHLFGLDSHYSSLIKYAKGKNKPCVVSPVYGGKKQSFAFYFYRIWLRCEKILPKPTIIGLRKDALDFADAVVVISHTEKNKIMNYFGVKEEKIYVVPNGIDDIFFNATPDEFENQYRIKDFILYVGRIEKRKNQVAFLEALRNLELPIVFIGEINPIEIKYGEKFRSLISNKNILWIRNLPQGSSLLASAYAASRVCVLISSSDSPALSLMEAAAAGTNIVASNISENIEYFSQKGNVWFCDPDDPDEIVESVLKAYFTDKNENIKRSFKNYTWTYVANELYKIYEKLV